MHTFVHVGHDKPQLVAAGHKAAQAGEHVGVVTQPHRLHLGLGHDE